MNNLKDYVNYKLTHADKFAEAEGYPLIMENCKANKRMKQLEIYGNSVQDGTPTPDNPIEVESVGIKSINLFDKDNFNIYKTSSADMSVTKSSTGISYISKNNDYGYAALHLGLASQYAGKTLTFSSPSYYSTDATYFGIRGTDGTNIKNGSRYAKSGDLYYSTITVEEDMYSDEILMLMLYCQNQPVDSVVEYKEMMITESDTPLPYEPYGKYKIPVVTRGTNLINVNDFKNGNFKVNDDGSCTLSWTLSSRFSAYNTKLGHIPAGSVVVFKASIVEATTNNKYICIQLVYSNGTTKYLSCNGTTRITLDNTIKQIGLYIYNTEQKGSYITFKDFGLYYDNEYNGYEPYTEPTTTNIFLDEPLHKIGDYADYVDFKNNKVVRNTVMRVYDGVSNKNNPFNKSDSEENWSGKSTHGDKNENFWEYSLNDPLPIIPKYGHTTANDYKKVPICLQLPVKVGYYNSETSPPTVDKELIWFCQQARSVRLFLSKDRVDGNLTSFRNFLKSNPITVLCATYQPYEEPLNVDLPKLTAKTTIIEVDTSLTPSNAYGKYIKR